MALIVNFTKMEYISPVLFGEEDSLSGIIAGWDGSKKALAVLLADGNGRGGGDLHSEDPIIGTWAGDRIGIISETDVIPKFSLPGRESEPLEPQIKAIGKDVSAVVIRALIEGEGAYFLPFRFAPHCALSLRRQRAAMLESETFSLNSRKRLSLDCLWLLCGAPLRLGLEQSMQSLQSAMNQLFSELHPGRPSTLELSDYSRKLSKEGHLIALKFKLTVCATDEKPRKKVISLKEDFDPAEIFETIFETPLYFQAPVPDDDAKAKAFVQSLLQGA